jgi:dihydrofolate reductase
VTTPPQYDAGQATEQVPVCPRHPDRVSYVRCQRCERPVCPECQRPAAVGVQCVDCVREQSRGVRSARTVFGGAVGTVALREGLVDELLVHLVPVLLGRGIPLYPVCGEQRFEVLESSAPGELTTLRLRPI